MRKKTLLLLLIILALAVFFRFWQLDSIPPGLYPDVAINGNEALMALESKNFKVFYPENNGREGLFINLIALSFSIFGVSVWAIKFVPAIIGVLTVLGLYFLAKELLNNKAVALLSSFFLAISFWHVNFSRIGFRAIMTPFCLVWGFYFLLKALKATPIPEFHPNKKSLLPSVIWFSVSGLFFGLGFHTYIAFRFVLLILGLVFIIEVIKYWPKFKSLLTNHSSLITLIKRVYIKDGWFRWDIFCLVIILVVSPLAIYFYQNPQDFIGRATGISIFATEHPWPELAKSIIKTLGMFNVIGDYNWRHNISGSPQLLWPIGILFLIGIIFSVVQLIKSLKQKNIKLFFPYCLLMTWFFVMLLPAILTYEGLPHALRSIGVIPPVFIFAGLGGYRLLFFLTKKKVRPVLFCSFVIIGLVSFFLVQYRRYFIVWGNNPEVRGAFTENYVNEAIYLKNLSEESLKYVIVNEPGVPVPYPDGIPMPAQTIMFISRQTPNLFYLKSEQISQLPDKSSVKQPIYVLPMKEDTKLFDTLTNIYPISEIKKLPDFSVLIVK